MSRESGKSPPAKKAYRPKPRDEVARNMSAIRSGENRTEVALRRALYALGLRYRKYANRLPGRPDLVFRRSRVVVFVDGDYWHARELVEGTGTALRRRLRRLPEESRKYWLKKFRYRVGRDREVTELLRRDGWTVIRLWESDVRRDVDSAARRIATKINQGARRQAKKSGRERSEPRAESD